MKKPHDNLRSSHWSSFRKGFLDGKACAVCGGTKKLEAHHIQPFHLHPERELDAGNLIALCEGNREVNCHLFVGHLGNYRGFNPNVRADAEAWHQKLSESRARLVESKKP